MKDWVTQVPIGLFMGTFVYLCLVFLVTHEDTKTTFVPQISLITSWLLVVGSFGFLVYYNHRIASSIQNPDLIARIVDDMAPSVATGHPVPAVGACELTAEAMAAQIAAGASVPSDRSGYVQEIDHAALVAAAAEADAVVHVLFRPGQFVFRGEPLARVFPAARGAAVEGAVRRHVTRGRHRTMNQDFEFGIAQIVEIAIRALSPAVNDTFTGVACVDWMGDALLVAAEAPPTHACWHDADGAMRLGVRPLRLERLVRLAFDQIRQAAADNPAVLIRILETIRRVAPRVRGQEPRRALLAEVDAVWEAASAEVKVSLDRSDVEAAWRLARPPLEPLASPE
jgi:uncharacterized membrane protein